MHRYTAATATNSCWYHQWWAKLFMSNTLTTFSPHSHAWWYWCCIYHRVHTLWSCFSVQEAFHTDLPFLVSAQVSMYMILVRRALVLFEL